MLISDLQLTITPAYALYTQTVSDNQLTVNESVAQGRHSIILDFNDSEGLYVRDLGTIFSWPMTSGTILDLWQPTVTPLDEDLYQRMSFHFLMKSLGGVGWQHARECNIAYAATAPLTLLLSFDDAAVPSSISLTIPASTGQETKAKVTLPPNKFKLVEGWISSAQPFLFWSNDMELKIKSWGTSEPYRIAKPFSG